MKDFRARSLALLEVGEKSKIPGYEIKAVVVAQMWLSLDIIRQQLTFRAN
jgi:hypothetical protein